jgi:hypothetical protein
LANDLAARERDRTCCTGNEDKTKAKDRGTHGRGDVLGVQPLAPLGAPNDVVPEQAVTLLHSSRGTPASRTRD